MGEIISTEKNKVFSEPYTGLTEKPRCNAKTLEDYVDCLRWPNDPNKIRLTWPKDADNIHTDVPFAHYIRIDRFTGRPLDSEHTSKQVPDRSSDDNYRSIEIDDLYPNYYYKVRISDSLHLEEDIWTDENSIVVKPGHIHPPYYVKAYAVSENSIRLYWQGFADSYEIRYRIVDDPEWEIIPNIQSLQYTFNELKKEATYEFQVRCRNISGFISYWGPAPCLNDIHVPTIPEDIQKKLDNIDKDPDNQLATIKRSYPTPLIVTLDFTPADPIIEDIEDSNIGATTLKFNICFPKDVEYPWGGAIDPRAKRFKLTYTVDGEDINKTIRIAPQYRLDEDGNKETYYPYILENLISNKVYYVKCMASNGENESRGESNTIRATTKDYKLVFRSADSALKVDIIDNKIGWIPSKFNSKELPGNSKHPKFPEHWIRNGGRRAGLYYHTHNKRLVFDPTYARIYPAAGYVLKFLDSDGDQITYINAAGESALAELKFKEGFGDWEKFWEIDWNPFLENPEDAGNPNAAIRQTLIVELYEGN